MEVQRTDKEGDKHVGVVAFSLCIVEGCHNVRRIGGIGGHVAEQRTRHRHKEGGWNTLARHVADAEVQLLVADVEVEEVATDTLGRGQRAIDVDIVAFRIWREGLG